MTSCQQHVKKVHLYLACLNTPKLWSVTDSVPFFQCQFSALPSMMRWICKMHWKLHKTEWNWRFFRFFAHFLTKPKIHAKNVYFIIIERTKKNINIHWIHFKISLFCIYTILIVKIEQQAVSNFQTKQKRWFNEIDANEKCFILKLNNENEIKKFNALDARDRLLMLSNFLQPTKFQHSNWLMQTKH